MSYLNGYLMGISELCHGLNYVPIHEFIPCLVLSGNVFIDIQRQISLASSTIDACKKCSNFEVISNWEEHFATTLDKWIFNLVFSRGLLDSHTYQRLKDSAGNRLIYLLADTLIVDELRVWKFQIGQGCCHTYGFDNESYAFESGENLFIATFGWSD
jgi:hypothetical protein